MFLKIGKSTFKRLNGLYHFPFISYKFIAQVRKDKWKKSHYPRTEQWLAIRKSVKVSSEGNEMRWVTAWIKSYDYTDNTKQYRIQRKMPRL